MRQSCLFHEDSSFVEPLLQLLLQCFGYLVNTGTESGLMFLPVVVGVQAGKMPKSGFCLCPHVGLVVFDIEERASCVVDLPNHDRSNLDRVATLVVDFELVSVERLRPE